MTSVAIRNDVPLRNLTVLLVAQLVLAAVLLWWQGRDTVAVPQPLFTFDTAAVDRLVIEGPDSARVELQRRGNADDAKWVIASAGDFPADGNRVSRVIERLHELKASAPVATSSGAAERFKVADKSFERRIQADAGGKTAAALLLGGPQGTRQTSARKAGDDAVYSVDWPTYELGTRTEDWMDRTALRLPEDSVTGVEADGRALDEEAVKRVAKALSTLDFQGLRTGEDARSGLGRPELSLTVQRREGDPVSYALHPVKDSQDKLLVVSTRAETFTLAPWQADPLKEAVKGKAD